MANLWRRQPGNRVRSGNLVKRAATDTSVLIANEFFEAGPPVFTGSGGLSFPVSSQAGTGALSFIATAALGFAFLAAGVGAVANPVTGTGDLGFSVSANVTATQTFSGNGGASFNAAHSATGELRFLGTGAPVFAPTLAATGSQTFLGLAAQEYSLGVAGSGAQEFLTSGGLTLSALLDGLGGQIFGGVAGLHLSLGMGAEGGQAFGANGGVAFAPVLEGEGSQDFAGSGALSHLFVLSGQGETAGQISGIAGIGFSCAIQGEGIQTFSGYGSGLFECSVSGLGTQRFLILSGPGFGFRFDGSGPGGPQTVPPPAQLSQGGFHGLQPRSRNLRSMQRRGRNAVEDSLDGLGQSDEDDEAPRLPNRWDLSLRYEQRMHELLDGVRRGRKALYRMGSIWAPKDFVPFHKTGIIPTPLAAAGDVEVLSFEVPTGYDGMISALFHLYTGPVFQEGGGDLEWRLQLNRVYAVGMGRMLTRLGGTNRLYLLEGGLQIQSGQRIRYIVNAPNLSGAILPLATRIVCCLEGLFYART